ncbi:MAG TPA: hypothetical protein VFG15_07045 [Amycolatopsis sp.]|nr:hypothetical protein [Amycolatopsis sp.]
MPIVIESRTRWTHTGIDAPYTFTISEFNQLETGRGVAYSARLIHPQLGVVGLIDNAGSGGPTTFHPNDPARFGRRQLEQFLERSLQDGEPMDDALGMETLLDEIINEAETEQAVARMRAEGQFLVRSYVPREAQPFGPHREAPVICSRFVARLDKRASIATWLNNDPAHRPHDGAHWQMFNGEDWVPLLGPGPLTEGQIAERARRASELALELEDPHRQQVGVPFGDDLYFYGSSTRHFTLIGDDVSTVNTTTWCRCNDRRNAIGFEKWRNGVLIGSGSVHATRECRALVRLD